jgi:HSP20 family protein
MKINVSTGKSDASAPRVGDDGQGYNEKRTERRETAVTYRETKDALELKMEMPGAQPDQLDVRVRGRKLTVEYEKEEKSRTPLAEGRERVETKTERLTREVELPVDVDPAHTDAVYKDGVLKLTLGKLGANGNGSHRITVK